MAVSIATIIATACPYCKSTNNESTHKGTTLHRKCLDCGRIWFK